MVSRKAEAGFPKYFQQNQEERPKSLKFYDFDGEGTDFRIFGKDADVLGQALVKSNKQTESTRIGKLTGIKIDSEMFFGLATLARSIAKTHKQMLLYGWSDLQSEWVFQARIGIH
eukprot:UN27112